MSRGRNIQGVVHLQNQNYLRKGSLKCEQKVINGHKNPSDSHNYHDQNHDEIEFYLGNSDRSTSRTSTLEQRTPKKTVRLAIRLWGAADQCTMSQVPIYIPWHREYWNIQLKAHVNPHSIKSSNTPAWPYQFWYVCLLETVYFNQ